MDTAPVVLFTYKRFEHTKLVLESLSKNLLADRTILYIFCDAAKSEKDFKDVDKTREMIMNFDYSCFADHHIVLHDTNYGLARSVISGVTDVINKHGKVIVVEDDTVTAPDFLKYMNDGLKFFLDDKSIGSIGGYRARVALPNTYKHDIVKLTRSSSYCWATWKDRWDKVDWNVSDYSSFRFNIVKRLQFGKDKSQLLDAQMQGRVDSWAIRFSYSLWENGCYSILPVDTRAKNIGYDKTGTHFREQLECNSPFVVDLKQNLQPVHFTNVPYCRKIDRDYRKIFDIDFAHAAYAFIKNIIYCAKKE